MSKQQGPKILIVDIETSPIEAHVWDLFDQNIGLNQIIKDWSILCWTAKWRGQKELFFESVRHKKNKRDDKPILKTIWELIDEADIVVGQNSKRFDTKKLNARFIINKFPPPSKYRHQDTVIMAKMNFAMTSNKLEYLSGKLCKIQKLKHKRFPGHELWTECLNGNPDAWDDMEKYNKQDVLATEELYELFLPWDQSINFDVFHKNHDHVCSCGSTSFQKFGFRFTNAGKHQRWKCNDCGKDTVDKENLLSKEKRKSLRK